MRNRWCWSLAALVVCMVGWDCVCLAQVTGGESMSHSRRNEIRNRLKGEMEAKRLERLKERYQNGSRTFVDSRGIPTLTNKLHKYRSNGEYTEIKFDYKPIIVPKEYRYIPSPRQYTRNNLEHLVSRYAQQYSVPESLIYAVIKVESNGNPMAVSRAGASGLMQLMPGTAGDMGVTNIFDPAQNIAGGTQYLSKLLELFKGNKTLALAGYNAGPENVKRYNGVPPFKETQNYVREVLRYERSYRSSRVRPSYVFGFTAPNPAAIAKAGSGESKTSPAPAKEAAQKQETGVASNAKKPSQGKYYTIHFKNGKEKRVEDVKEGKDHYYVTSGRMTSRISKERVARIVEPA